MKSVSRSLIEYFCCPEEYATFETPIAFSIAKEYFNFGSGILCYGRRAVSSELATPTHARYDHSVDARGNGDVLLPFDPDEIIDNLRLERHADRFRLDICRTGINQLVHTAYYAVRPCLPVRVRKHLQRGLLNGWDKPGFPNWPADTTVDDLLAHLLALQIQREGNRIPFIWFWPEGYEGCAILTHDVESRPGYEFCSALMDIDESFGLRSSFQLVPNGRYTVSAELLKEIRNRGFEINVHDYNHDGHLFRNRSTFDSRAKWIRKHAIEFGSKGFRSAVMYRHPDWLPLLDFEYDMSIPNTARFDPQHGGCCTVMPYFIGHTLELPLTTIQDYPLFNVLNTRSIDLWKAQTELIMRKHGLASFLIHPDYILARPERDVYFQLLAYIKGLQDKRTVWIPKPQDVNEWWRARAAMRVVKSGSSWTVEGPHSDRARVAFAALQDGQLVYEMA